MAVNNKREFEQGRLKHLLFRSKLRAILLDADVDEAPVLSEHDCPFGQWMQTYLLKHCAGTPELRELETLHTEMHRVARLCVRYHQAGAEEAASREMSRVENLENRVQRLLEKLDAIEKSKANRNQIDELRARIAALTTQL